MLIFVTTSNDAQGLGGSQGAIISAAFTHMRTVTAFSMQHQVSEQYALAVEEVSRDRQYRSRYIGASAGFCNAVMLGSYALIFW